MLKNLWSYSVLAFILWISALQGAFATGPSTITAEIVPLAMNPAGDVLCKSRYSENRMGSHSLMPTNYALCIVKEGRIQPIPESDWHFAADESAENYFMEYGRMNQQFKDAKFAANDPLVADFYEELLAEGFQKIDVADYQLEPRFSLGSFQERWNVEYLEQVQAVLYHREKPTVYGDYDLTTPFLKTTLLYQINNQIWLEYEDCPMDMTVDCDQYDVITPDFYFADDGEDSETGEVTGGPIPYDWKQKVTSVIFLPEIL